MTTNEQWWKFGGSNLEAIYGFGTRDEANRYADWLNRKRDINHYYISEPSEAKVAELESGNEGFNLAEELAGIAAAE